MRLRNIPEDTTTVVSALPISLPAGKVGALLLHGFAHTPRDLAGLSGDLGRRGVTVSVPRLPGHGTNGGDFLQSGWRDWLRASVDAYADLRARCQPVHVVGFSMGGLIAVLLASRFPVGRLALLAPALQAKNRLLPLTPVLKFFARRIRRPLTDTTSIDDADSAVLAREYDGWRYLAQAASLLRLQRMARRALSKVTSDTLTVVGDADRSVPLSVIPMIENGIRAARKRHLVIENGSHVLCVGKDGERAAAAVVTWFLD
jgi:carboxylesterase